MTKAELIKSVVDTLPKDSVTKKLAEQIVDATFVAVTESLKADSRFSFPGFGTFSVKERKARKGRNPQTGKEINIPARKTVSFKPAPRLKETLN